EKDYLDRIRESFHRHERRLTAVMIGGNLANANEEARRRLIESNIRKLKCAAYLRVPGVRMDPGGLRKGEDNPREGRGRVAAACQQMLPVAADLGVRVTIENHGGVTSMVENVLAVIRRSDPKWLGCNLDFGNAPVNQNPQVFQRLAPYAWHTHAKAQSFKDDGEATDSDYGKLLGILKSFDYAGAVSIEFEGKGESIDGVRKTRALILKHWPDLPN